MDGGIGIRFRIFLLSITKSNFYYSVHSSIGLTSNSTKSGMKVYNSTFHFESRAMNDKGKSSMKIDVVPTSLT